LQKRRHIWVNAAGIFQKFPFTGSVCKSSIGIIVNSTPAIFSLLGRWWKFPPIGMNQQGFGPLYP
jgi:hypothetical protein